MRWYRKHFTTPKLRNGERVIVEFEATTWTSSSKLEDAWITYTLAEDTPLSEICLKMGAFRSKAYPIEIYAGDVLVWRGYTPKSLGYVRLPLQKAGVKEMDKRNDEKRVAGGTTLRIIEAEFLAPAKDSRIFVL